MINFPDEGKLGKVCMYITEGIGEEEACILSGMEYDEFKEAKQHFQSVAKRVRYSEVKFKYSQLKKVGKDPKSQTAMWLLESRFPDEYGKKKKKDSDQDSAATFAARFIKEIQKGNNDTIVKYEQGKDGYKEPQAIEVKDVLK